VCTASNAVTSGESGTKQRECADNFDNRDPAVAHPPGSEIEGVFDYDGERKHFRKFEEGGLYVEMVEPFRSVADPSEFSRIVIRKGRHKVLQIQWCTDDYFTVSFFEPGEWEWTLRDWPPPVPL